MRVDFANGLNSYLNDGSMLHPYFETWAQIENAYSVPKQHQFVADIEIKNKTYYAFSFWLISDISRLWPSFSGPSNLKQTATQCQSCWNRLAESSVCMASPVEEIK